MSDSITGTGSAELPSTFRENVLRVCGDRGEAWLRELPMTLAELERRWKISVGPSFPGLSYNFVAPAVLADGESVVVKLGLPVDDGEIHSETDYLRELNGDGVVKLIDEDRGPPGATVGACCAGRRSSPHIS